MATKPTPEQAQLHLQVYDLRREPRLRQARDWFQQNYRAQTIEDAMRICAGYRTWDVRRHGDRLLGASVRASIMACCTKVFSLRRAESSLEFGKC